MAFTICPTYVVSELSRATFLAHENVIWRMRLWRGSNYQKCKHNQFKHHLYLLCTTQYWFSSVFYILNLLLLLCTDFLVLAFGFWAKTHHLHYQGGYHQGWSARHVLFIPQVSQMFCLFVCLFFMVKMFSLDGNASCIWSTRKTRNYVIFGYNYVFIDLIFMMVFIRPH